MCLILGVLEHGLADERRMNWVIWSSWRVGGFGIFSCLFSRLPSLVLAPLSLHSFTLSVSNVPRHVRSSYPRQRCLGRRLCSSTALHHQPQSYLLVGYVPKSRLYASSSDFSSPSVSGSVNTLAWTCDTSPYTEYTVVSVSSCLESCV
jgi:hypothetical protein